MKLTKWAVFSAIAFQAASGSSAFAQQQISVNIGSSYPTTNVWANAAKEAFQPEVDRILKAKGNKFTINWRESYGSGLFKFNESRAAVRDRIVDVAPVISGFEAAAMPLQNVTVYTPFATTNHEALIEIFDKLNADLSVLRDSWTSQNLVPLASLVTDSYEIFTKNPIKDIKDLQNRRITAPGSTATWLRGTGAIPVAGAITTMYTDIQTGVTEGALSFNTGIAPARIYEVAPHGTKVGIGAMYVGSIAINKRFFDGLPKDVQDAFREAGKAASIAHGKNITRLATTALDTMTKGGLKMSDLPEAARMQWINGMPNLPQPWLEANGEPARTVLRAYFSELRAKGIKPQRDWSSAQ
ncbi:C4-dicarboxylate TRAP transporter substrate-binding protein [Limnohabitans sp. Rim8]|uniref:C4-dicarboxylate TRAP transporter substrate-binding protein n=1 Tax=Limnohabitans sp. Rim8 TaxID=1100718 RepID=UPI0026134A66|nr:C4-dicarboxylate TRAP transporter substrate-binding protein [Limnohabitans sp. Rim8]